MSFQNNGWNNIVGCLRINNNFRELSTEFLNAYYNTFSTNIKLLPMYYLPTALLTYMAEELNGIDAIRNKFNTVQFTNPKHTIIKILSQPVDGNRIYILVIGTITETIQSNWMSNKSDAKVTNYTETFLLINENKSWYIQNHMFQNI